MSEKNIYSRIDRKAAKDLYRAKLPEPVDVLNLIDFADREQYRWYGMAITPLIYGLGGSVRWAAEWERSLLGERQAEELLIVRYPNHRRFLLMTMNPYYKAINRWRERGVARFEASFCHANEPDRVLSRERKLLVAHVNSADPDRALERLSATLTAVGAELVYEVRETSSFSFFRRFRPYDPNPLKYKQVAFFRLGADGAAAIDAKRMTQLSTALPDLSLQLYRQARPESLLPAPVAKLMRRFA